MAEYLSQCLSGDFLRIGGIGWRIEACGAGIGCDSLAGMASSKKVPMWTVGTGARYKRNHLRYPSDLTDEEWALVEPLIPPGKPGGGKRRVNRARSSMG